MTLAAVVVTYNRLAQLQTTLARLLDEAVDQIIVVDNASTDGTGAWLAAQSDARLHVLPLTKNTGGAGGFEAGVRHAQSQFDPDWICLMDDDARPLPGAFAAFTQRYATPPEDLGAVAAAVLNPDGSICEMNRPSLNPFWHWDILKQTLLRLKSGDRRGFHIGDSAYKPGTQTPLDVASFVGFFAHRTALARTGLPNGGYFIYGDDVTFSLRMRRRGLRLVMDADVGFEHDCGTLSIDLVTRPLWKVYYLSRNGVAMTWWAARWGAPLAFAYYVATWMRKTRHYAPHERPTYRRLMWRGIWHGLTGRRGRDDIAHVQSAALEARSSSG